MIDKLIVRTFKLYNPELASSPFAHVLRKEMRRAYYWPHDNHECLPPDFGLRQSTRVPKKKGA